MKEIEFRDIKFKAWFQYGKKMIYDEELMYQRKADNIGGFKWLQYTGLKDKNGKEIYEGDIIDKGNRAVVLFSCGRFQPAYDKGMAEDMEDDFYRFSDEIAVIGNIYENPELLEEEDDRLS